MATKQPIFKEKRDAWATIRGYVYQVDLTIQRWLELEPGFELELERGEDVDTIHKAMNKRGKTQARLLEQIKVRDTNVTLRSSAVLGALAYFYDHERNVGLNLKYRYVTNAQIGKERNARVRGGMPLLAQWNQLTQVELSNDEQSKTLKLIRGFLRKVRRPKGFPEATWKPFAKFIKHGNSQAVDSFIRKIEWLTHQTGTALVGPKIKEILTLEYEIPAEQAQTVYSVLFFHVFKLLTQSGIKRLTIADRESVIASPQVSSEDQALFANLSQYQTDLSHRVDALEKAVGVLQPRALPAASEICQACSKVTDRLVKSIVDGRKSIDRENFRDHVDEFLGSEQRYFIVLGPSGVGKSISAATDAKRLSDAGKTVLLVKGKYFSLEQAANLISQEIWPSITDLSWQKVIEVLAKNESTETPVFVLYIDAIDEADDLPQLSAELSELHDSIAASSPKKLKIIITCRDIAWGRFSQQRLMPLYESAAPSDGVKGVVGGYASTIIGLSDFTSSELDRALQEIGATELINPGRFGDTASSHIATFREMLKHPATFEHYADLRQTNNAPSIQNITWTYLIKRRLDKALAKAARQCHKSAGDLKKILERLAIFEWKAGSKNFQLSRDEINSAAPELTRNNGDASVSPLLSLIDNRILSEFVVVNRSEIAFHSSDLGAYLLSFELERQTDNRNPPEVRELLKQWLNESWNFPPLLDALLALLDRFLDRPHSSASLAMLEVLVESDRFHNSSVFELMRPEALKTIFDIIKEADDSRFYDYRDAALGVRASPSALEEIRSHLKDENGRVRQLAAELAGAHRDGVAVNELIQLLRDPDEDVQYKTFIAFAHIGEPAITPLLNVITDSTQPVELRSSCITALRNVGSRTAGVSATLKQAFEQAKTYPELLESSFLTAAALRDQGHSASAKQALRHESEPIVRAAAKYLTEVPDPGAFNSLLQLLKRQAVDPSKPYKRVWVINQAIKALWETNEIKAAPVLLKLVANGLQGRSELQPVRAIHVTEKIDLPEILQLVFEYLIKNLSTPEGRLVWESANVLGATWRTNHLKALIKQNREMLAEGTDTSKLLVDAIIPGIQESEEFRLGDRLNRVSDLSTVIKCQAKNFASEATRLFKYSSALSCEKLSRLLWICGDTRAEDALIHRFENPSREHEAIHERSYVARALGTCGGLKGANIILNYLRNRGEELRGDFPETTIYPLLIRKLLNVKELSNVARDSKVNWSSRASILIALSDINAKNLGTLFADVAQDSSGQPRLQAQAVRLLALTKDFSKLRHFLGKSEHSIVKAQAAQGLAWLNDISSVHMIERAFEESPALGFASALAHFHKESSLPILLDRLGSASFQWKPEYLQALAAFWRFPAGKRAILDQFDRWSDPEEYYLNNQSALITGLAKHEPDIILDQFNKAFDDGYLTTTARETMAKKIADLFYRKYDNEILLLESVKRLLSDKHVPARERAAHALAFANAPFCLRLYKHVHDSADANEWERASAVYSLGFWKSPISLIEKARCDEQLLVRGAADKALEIRLKKPHLERHFKQFNQQNGLARLSSYLCLADQGDQSTIWALNDNKKISPYARTFRRRLYKQIESRLADEYKKKIEEERKLPDSRGAIMFD
jgi:HEAT repeat protein